MKYLKYFENSAAIGGGVEVDLPNVSYLEGKNTLFVPGYEGQATVKVNSTTGEIESETGPDYSQMYLTFEAIESGTFKFSKAINYSIDNGTTWVNLPAATNTPTITAGNTIMWKGTLTPGNSGIGTFSATGNFNAYGNIMSLLYGDNFVGQANLTGKSHTFQHMFNTNTKIINAKNIILPATTLASECYNGMFYSCINLTTTPELPATTLANYCYLSMFANCTSLTTAPALPATTLARSCYSSMFSDCTSLTTAPTILPATTLANNCYENMFYNTSLTTAPALPATTLADYCYHYMFQGCTSLTTAPALPATTLVNCCYQEMFYGCTNLVKQSIVPNSVKPVQSIYCRSMYYNTQVPVNTNDYAYEAWEGGGGPE